MNNNNNIETNCVSNNNNNKMTSKTRLIRLYRDGSTQLGFSIRGGWEHGTGIFVSEVHPGSESAKQGLQPNAVIPLRPGPPNPLVILSTRYKGAGDQIVRINGFSLEHAVHDDVIALVKSSSKITLKVKSVGMIPIKDRLSDVLTWKLLAPSPTPSSLSSSPSPPWTSSDSHSDSEHEFLEAKIFIDLRGMSLGCSVVRGPPSCPGIFVQNVKFNEIADQSGLEVGDQIIQVNSVNISVMDFNEAISKLKSLASMTLTVRKGAGRHLFGIGVGLNHNNRNNGSINENNSKTNKSVNNYNKTDNCVQKKRVTAIVHHSGSNGNTHSRMLSTSSNGSEQSSSSSGIHDNNTNNSSNTNGSDNDFSISEMQNTGNCVQNNKTICFNNNNINKSINNNNVNNNNNNNLLNESSLKILEKVKQEEERLADERRRLEEEQHKLKIEMQKLELEKKDLERRKQLEECNSLSNCSISSASNSSSGSQSISFLEEIKAMGDHKRLLRPVNSADNRNNNLINNKLIANKANEINGKTNIGSKLVTPLKNCDNNSDKHKQHELLMEEFRRAHRRMFGDNDNISQKSDKSSKSEPNPIQIETKESVKETKSLPITTTLPAVTTVKTPPAVPIKKAYAGGPVVQIGTYGGNNFTNNRFVAQNHRSVIQVRREDSTDSTLTNGDNKDSQITIKVISTKQ